MKKVSILIAMMIGVLSFSQNWTFGVKAGVNFASVKGSYEDVSWVKSLEGMTGFHAGGWANHAFTEKSALQIELLGSLQGGDIQYQDIPNPIDGTLLQPKGELRLPYIQIPIMYQYKPMDKLYVEAGPQLNFLPKVNVKAFLNGEEVEDEQAADAITNRLKDSNTFDIGLNVGAGYEFIDKWTGYVRYTHGLITVDNREEDQRDLKNRVIALGISYRIF